MSCPRLCSTKWRISDLASRAVSPTARLLAAGRPDGQDRLQAAPLRRHLLPGVPSTFPRSCSVDGPAWQWQLVGGE